MSNPQSGGWVRTIRYYPQFMTVSPYVMARSRMSGIRSSASSAMRCTPPHNGTNSEINSEASWILTSFTSVSLIKENIGLYGGNVSDIEAVNRAGTTELLIAVSTSQRGVFRWDSIAEQWESVTNPSDASIPGQIAGSATLTFQEIFPTLRRSSCETGTCPISSCDIEIQIVGVDPIDTTGNTIFIAGSSINGQPFKSVGSFQPFPSQL